MKYFKSILDKIGFLHDSHSKSERVASYILNGSFVVLAILILVAIIDEFLLNRILHERLRFDDFINE